MTASYPTAIKSFTTKVDGSTTIEASHINDAQDETVAIETAIGVSPYSIDSSVVAGANPTSIANYLDMVANRIKAIVGGTYWYSAPATSINAFDSWSWSAASLQNSWANYGNGYADASYYKDGFNIVHIRGLVKSGSVPATIFTLPSGYRPAKYMMWLQGSTDAFARVDIYPTGEVYANYVSGATTYLTLDKMQFPIAS